MKVFLTPRWLRQAADWLVAFDYFQGFAGIIGDKGASNTSTAAV